MDKPEDIIPEGFTLSTDSDGLPKRSSAVGARKSLPSFIPAIDRESSDSRIMRFINNFKWENNQVVYNPVREGYYFYPRKIRVIIPIYANNIIFTINNRKYSINKDRISCKRLLHLLEGKIFLVQKSMFLLVESFNKVTPV